MVCRVFRSYAQILKSGSSIFFFMSSIYKGMVVHFKKRKVRIGVQVTEELEHVYIEGVI